MDMDFNNMNNLNSGDHTGEFDTQDVMDHKIICLISYIPVLFWLPLVACGGSRYGRFHANQSLILLLAGLVLGFAVSVIGLILGWIPLLGGIIVGLLRLVVSAATVAWMLYGMINTGNGNAKELPIIGGLLQLIH